MVDRQHVPVRVSEEGLPADARVEGLAVERHAARLELGLRSLEVVDVEGDGVVVRLEGDPERIGLHHAEGQVAGLELAGRHLAPALRERQA